MRLLRTLLLWGAGNCARIFPAAGEILPIGMRFPANCVRPAPVLASPVAGSKTRRPPATPAARYWLRSQKPVVFVAGLQVLRTVDVGTVKVPLTPFVCRVPW